jgi:hypothetical protein
MQELAQGESLGSIAEAHGKSRDELKSFLQQQVDQKVDDAVAAGMIPADRADELKTKLSSHLDEIIDGRLPKFERHFRFRGDGAFEDRGDDGETSPTPGAQSGSSLRS